MLCTEDGTVPSDLRAGNIVRIKGTFFTMRDSSLNLLAKGSKSLRELDDENAPSIFFASPSCVSDKTCLSIGPTTSGRFEAFFQYLVSSGVRNIMGKGEISRKACGILNSKSVVYFQALGGVAAYYGQRVKNIEPILYPEMGPEAIYKVTVADFPVIVSLDSNGNIFPEQKEGNHDKKNF
ncbi:MAG: fumarate hydratase C-terminal domain-containing protein [bacterium]